MIPVIAERADALWHLCRKHGIRRLDLFGSAAAGTFDTDDSDLDFLVEFDPISPAPTPMRTLAFWRAWRSSLAGPWTWWWTRLSATPISGTQWSRPGVPSMLPEANGRGGAR